MTLAITGTTRFFAHRVELPNAQLFYYTDLSQSVWSMESAFTYLQPTG